MEKKGIERLLSFDRLNFCLSDHRCLFSFRFLWMVCAWWLMFSACSDDRNSIPAWEEAYVDILTNSEGIAATLCTDDGIRYSIDTPPASIYPAKNCCYEVGIPKGSLAADTLYRCISYFEKTGNNRVRLNTTNAIVAVVPSVDSRLGTDPVSMQSVWRGGRYLNIYLTVKGTNGKHTFACVEDSIVQNGENSILHLTLRHRSTETIDGFPRKAYISCILEKYASRLTSCRDSIYLHVCQYDNADTVFKLAY